jgi:hypothetical protein
MKYLATTLLVFSFLWTLAQKEFAPIGATWYYSKYVSYNPPQFGYIKHECIKDSTIEGQPVKVIEKIEVPNDTTKTLLGYEYILQKGDSIFYWKSGDFHLLYNFSMNKGDSILLYSELPNLCGTDHYGWNKVDSTFHTDVNGIDLKSYYLSPINKSIWYFESFPILEKMGSLLYLIPQMAFCGISDVPILGTLRCYTDDSLGFFRYDNFISCDSTTTWKTDVSVLTGNRFFSIYPNPATNELFVKNEDAGKNEALTVDFFDIKGNKIVEKVLTQEKSKFDLTSLPKGSYLIIIKNNKKEFYHEKILKK